MLDLNERLAIVRQVPIFQEIENEEILEHLNAALLELWYPAGHLILDEGRKGGLLYILLSGKVEVVKDHAVLAQLGKGDFFGEMSIFNAAPLSASVRAVDECEILLLTQQQLYEAIEVSPGVAVYIIRILCRRVNQMNQALSEFQAQKSNQ
ncbi:cyclic nucleotide-binding domain-containing protein [Roseofilum reptotaenium CS-1145]|uniref:Cyclic nucleotide-binding domain-containing protein n=1 Tax=Roseofilum reptotaenium AO1-A TaxID=1925591 RepID=A0A1L9QUV4_9CYAN|nr:MULTISPECIES: cyclic nucleotide-binding domain-containing protein [Roseofilum]OJJ26460.1 hypothetical protein BI308_06295 [Roseofilum reptotaenium AO1-A]MBP0013854.1 cyclic nucleotide-binding domain-containing protein [Roseofilum sp. SID3]MBP0023686.1 cyclic nucleotide-binding domain-containing protein [Roseofilum sp. SID2]MBP0026822.1 cyclic nucleotide-binding domain-containing protein [Roseofilum sp. Guam]MBP0036090.1 cyclic nucleotide-binding domain-containing protein [Roseofilum sp. SID